MREPKQLIKVSSTPGRTKVYFKGSFLGLEEGRYLGETPSFMEVKRKFLSRIGFEKEGYYPKNVWLQKKYRWNDSFFANMVFLVGAPIGWAVDLFTGAAWEYESLQRTFLNPKSEKITEPPLQKVIAIAPPQSESELLSDKMGAKLEKILKQRYPDAKILPYKKTEQIFTNYSYTNLRKPLSLYLTKLEFELKANHIAKSNVRVFENTFKLDTSLYDVFSESAIDSFANEYPKEKLYKFNQSEILDNVLLYMHFFPNAVSAEGITAPVSLVVTGPGSEKYETDYSGLNFLTRYFNGVSITNIKSPKLSEHYKFIYRSFPDVAFRYRQEQFTSTGGQNDRIGSTSFNWYSLVLGYGIEVGLESPFGYPSLRLVGAFAYDRISWETDGSSLISFRPGLEIGYSFYTQNRINLKIFFRSFYYNESIWNDAFSQFSSNDLGGTVEGSSTFGIKVSYYFPEAKIKLKELLY